MNARLNDELIDGSRPYPKRCRRDEVAQVRQLLARYVRAADSRDGAAMSLLFEDKASLHIFHRQDGVPALLLGLYGGNAIGQSVDRMLHPHSPRGWSHHTTHDLIVDIHDDRARIDAQFIVFETIGDEAPASGWPNTAVGPQGIVRPSDAGYLSATLRKAAGVWKITTMHIVHDLPFCIPKCCR